MDILTYEIIEPFIQEGYFLTEDCASDGKDIIWLNSPDAFNGGVKVSLSVSAGGTRIQLIEFMRTVRDDGNYHRVGGPAFQSFYRDGTLEYESYYYNGRRHRLASEGPAKIWYNSEGGLSASEYWENGREVSSNP